MTTPALDQPDVLPPAADGEYDPPNERRHRRRRTIWLALSALIVAGAGAGAWLWTSDAATDSAPAATGPVATAAVELGTISATESWTGVLGHGTPITVTSGREGTITRIAGQGDNISRGDELYRVNEQPVSLFYGEIPMYRDLGPGDSGVDVEQFEANLAELGYDGFTVDDEYTWNTAEAVKEWQEDIGASPTGTVVRGDVFFVPAGGQVDALHTDVRDVTTPGMPILDLTGADQVVSLEADAGDRNLFEVETEATVRLAGGDEVTGVVTATAVVDDVPEDAGGAFGGGAASESVLQVEVTLTDEAADEFVGASVDVIVAIDERTDVLLVPVNALLALSEGGYGLEIVGADGATEIVAVETGLFADGKVEGQGAGISDGTIVGVAGR